MKKLLLLLMVASVGIAGTATAQKKSNKKCGNDKNKYSKKYDRRNDDRYDQRNGSYGKYSNNAPRPVRDAFYRDYPNASNVSWTKDRGVWTANFKRSGLFGGNSSVSYRANGQRVNAGNVSIGDRIAGKNTQQRPTVWNNRY